MRIKRQLYKGFIIDRDEFGRVYIWDSRWHPMGGGNYFRMSEDTGRIYPPGSVQTLTEIKAYIDRLLLEKAIIDRTP